MSHLHEALGRLSRALKDSLGPSGTIGHRLTVGEIREEDVRAALRPHLPGRYAVGSGIVVNAEGEESRQQDIVVTDASAEAPFISAGQLGVYPVEAVTAVVEVKSSASTETVVDGVEKVASVKRLISDQPRPFMQVSADRMSAGETSEKPFGGVLCLSLGGNAERISDAYIDANLELPRAQRANALVVVDHFTTCWMSGEHSDLKLEHSPLAAGFGVRFDLGEQSLMLFYLLLRMALSTYLPPTLDLLHYVNSAGGFDEHVLDVRRVPG